MHRHNFKATPRLDWFDEEGALPTRAPWECLDARSRVGLRLNCCLTRRRRMPLAKTMAHRFIRNASGLPMRALGH